MKNRIFRPILKLLTFFLIILFLLSSAYAAGVIDRTFGTNGKVTTQIELFEFEGLKDLIVQPDGKFIVTGTRLVSTTFFKFVARFNADGSPDTSFGNNGVTHIPVFPLAIRDAKLQSDGKIVIVGSASGDFFVARFTSQGLLDTSFGNGGIVTLNQGSTDIFNSVAIQSDGKIVAAGNTSDGGNRGAVIRFNPNGSIDTTFAAQGLFYFSFTATPTVTSAGYFDIKVLPNGKILTAATYYRTSDYLRGYFLTMLNSTGEIDLNFGAQGFAGNGRNEPCSNCSQEQAANFEVLPDGKIFIASFGGITVFNQNGSIYRQLPFEGRRTTMLPDGKVLVSGPPFSFGFVKLYSSESFIGKTEFPFRDVLSIAQPDGKILFAGFEPRFLTFWRLNSITSQGTRLADYNNNERTDIAVLRPTASALYVLYDDNTSNVFFSGEASFEARRVIPERYREPLAYPFVYWRGGNIIGSPASFCGTDGAGARQCVRWGLIGDIPVGGDYDGDRFAEITIFREGIWYFLKSATNQTEIVQWGTNGDKPVPADYDYDGITDLAVYRPSTGTWWVRRSSDGGSLAIRWGIASDIPLTGDFDGDGKADLTVYRASEGNWYQLLTTEGFRVVRFGISTDQPVPGDYDGDGRHDVAVFRNGVWYILQSTDGLKIVQWGISGDSPVAVRYDQ